MHARERERDCRCRCSSRLASARAGEAKPRQRLCQLKWLIAVVAAAGNAADPVTWTSAMTSVVSASVATFIVASVDHLRLLFDFAY